MALVVTPGAANANSFASVAEYKTYWGARPFATRQLALTDPQIEAALIQGCLILSASFDWTGSATDDVQALPWPRIGMQSRNKFDIASDVIPVDLKNSQCQLAGDLGIADRSEDNEALKQGLSSLKAGPVSLSWQTQSSTSNVEAMDAAIRRLGPEFDWLAKAISDAARLLLVPSWYTRAGLLRPIIFEAHR